MRRLLAVGLGFVVGCSADEPASSGSAGMDAGGSSAASGSGAGGAAGAAGGAGGRAARPADGGQSDASVGAPGERLSSTGLYADALTGELAEGVEPYEPRFVLWSDGATKRRWVYLPADARIDTGDMDFWRYPKGTKLWKEFTRDGVRVETRLLEKTGDADDAWRMIAFQWLEDQSDALARPDGVENASGTEHDIPSAEQCEECHGNMPGRSLSLTAIQLSHDGPGVTLARLVDAGRLSAPPSATFRLPGDSVAQSALGYLHANCGLCHNPHTGITPPGIDMYLWLSTQSLETVEATTTYASTVNEGNFGGIIRVDPGDPEGSEIHRRMNTRGGWPQMPPLGTERVDLAGLATVDAWILSLGPSDGGSAAEGGAVEAGAVRGPSDASTGDAGGSTD